MNEQFDFRDKLSTDMATYALLNKVLLSLEKKIMLVAFLATCKKRLIVSTMTFVWPK